MQIQTREHPASSPTINIFSMFSGKQEDNKMPTNNLIKKRITYRIAYQWIFTLRLNILHNTYMFMRKKLIVYAVGWE